MHCARFLITHVFLISKLPVIDLKVAYFHSAAPAAAIRLKIWSHDLEMADDLGDEWWVEDRGEENGKTRVFKGFFSSTRGSQYIL